MQKSSAQRILYGEPSDFKTSIVSTITTTKVVLMVLYNANSHGRSRTQNMTIVIIASFRL